MKVKIQLGQPKISWHQSSALDGVLQKRVNSRAIQLNEAVEWCQLNDCRGYLAIKSGEFPLIRDARTINKRLDSKIETGEEKRYCSILTDKEELSLVRYLKNRNR